MQRIVWYVAYRLLISPVISRETSFRFIGNRTAILFTISFRLLAKHHLRQIASGVFMSGCGFVSTSPKDLVQQPRFPRCLRVTAHESGRIINPFNASCSKLLLFEGFNAILV